MALILKKQHTRDNETGEANANNTLKGYKKQRETRK